MSKHEQTDQGVLQRLRQIEAWAPGRTGTPRRLFYMIEITRFCSLGCPVCYASAEASSDLHVPVDQVLALGQKIRGDGGRLVQLMGGEPADHPDVIEIVRGLCRLGLRPVMATNGLRLASEPLFARRLRRAGLRKVNIQFDTLCAETSVAMRGQDLVSLKRQAVENAAGAGLRVGLIATMCDRNVHEACDILRFAMSRMPEVNTVTFQSLAAKGRVPAGLQPTGRTAILGHLLNSANEAGFDLSPQDILPPPQYMPWRALTHPDCASILLLCRDRDASPVWALGRDVDLRQFYAALHAAAQSDPGIFNSILRPALALWRATRRGVRWDTFRRVVSMCARPGRRGLCVVHVDAIMDHARPDLERLRRCPACFVTDQGFRSACARFCASPADRSTA